MLTKGMITSNIDWNMGMVYIMSMAPLRDITKLLVTGIWKFNQPTRMPVAQAAIVLKYVACRSRNLTVSVRHAI